MAKGHWDLVLCGTSHKAAGIEVRETVQIGRDDLARAHSEFSSRSGIRECALVSTCNRVEFYFVASSGVDPFSALHDFYKAFRGVDITPHRSGFYVRKNRHAAAHLFSVAAGLDSLVLGENQILGQIKEAYSSACAVKATGKVIHSLFHQAFRVGKQVRTDTELGRGACSVSSAAVELLTAEVKDLSERPVILVGVNKMTALAASLLTKHTQQRFAFCNRTLEKAMALAERFGGSAHGLDRLPELMASAGLVITCTGSPEPVIDESMIRSALAAEQDHPWNPACVIVDLAVPRDVAFSNEAFEAVRVVDMDAIQAFVERNRKRKEAAIPQAQALIDRKLDEFGYWLKHVRYEPAYNGLSDTFETLRREALEGLLEELPAEWRDKVNRATEDLVERLSQIKVRASQ